MAQRQPQPLVPLSRLPQLPVLDGPEARVVAPAATGRKRAPAVTQQQAELRKRAEEGVQTMEAAGQVSLYSFNINELYEYDLPNIRLPSDALTAMGPMGSSQRVLPPLSAPAATGAGDAADEQRDQAAAEEEEGVEEPEPDLSAAAAAAIQPNLNAAATAKPKPDLSAAAAAAAEPEPNLSAAAAATAQPELDLSAAAAVQPAPGLSAAAAATQPNVGAVDSGQAGQERLLERVQHDRHLYTFLTTIYSLLLAVQRVGEDRFCGARSRQISPHRCLGRRALRLLCSRPWRRR